MKDGKKAKGTLQWLSRVSGGKKGGIAALSLLQAVLGVGDGGAFRGMGEQPDYGYHGSRELDIPLRRSRQSGVAGATCPD